MSLRALFLVSFAAVLALHVAFFYSWRLLDAYLPSGMTTFYAVPVLAELLAGCS